MKRGQSDYCLVVGVNKPRGLSSHDVVNRVRRIFGERRVGHAGTLDPLAEGVLPVCVGPATRLATYLSGHDKRYVVRIAFGISTETDDSEGAPLHQAEVPEKLSNESFARRFVEGLVGQHRQLPPAYSAVKVQGVKACDAARKGHIIDLKPREVEVYEAALIGMGSGYVQPGQNDPSQIRDLLWWDVEFSVSKGTYIRSLARDIGLALSCPAHVTSLRRTQVGSLSLEECVSLETLAEVREAAACDPVRLLGLRLAFVDDSCVQRVFNGAGFAAGDLKLFEQQNSSVLDQMCACSVGLRESDKPPYNGELVSLIAQNKLAGLYAFNAPVQQWQARRVFQKGVLRGKHL